MVGGGRVGDKGGVGVRRFRSERGSRGVGGEVGGGRGGEGGGVGGGRGRGGGRRGGGEEERPIRALRHSEKSSGFFFC